MEEEEYEGVSFGRIVKVAFHRWKLLLIITFGVGIVGFLGLYFGYNAFANVYNATFSYSDTGLASETKADNTTFNYRSLISLETLNAVKAKSADYASIDVEGLTKNNAFTINRAVDKDTNKISYTISIKKNKMPKIEVSRQFFTDLAYYPIEQDKEYIANTSFDTALQKIDTVEKYEDAVNFLLSQANNMISGYTSLQGLNISTELSEQIETTKSTISSIVDGTKIATLRSMIVNYGLTPDYKAIDVDSLNQTIIALDNDDPARPGQKQDNEALIADIMAQITVLGDKAQLTSLDARIRELTEANHNIDIQVRKIKEQIANANKSPEEVAGHTQFVKDMTLIRTNLANQIPEYKNTMNKVYVDNAKVVFENNNNVIDITKNMNLVFSILLPVAAGFVIALITNLIVDRKLLHEEEGVAQAK
ncbi:MAG: hypothetical protein E7178_06635 [Erysipelotrichaceae bacterium]|jgi:regulator of replication initiation timing|nr:hypothetical protein [Erysipelotrichaceae bacterium]